MELSCKHSLYISGIRSNELWYSQDRLFECISILFIENFLNLVRNLSPAVGLDQPDYIINAQGELVAPDVRRLAAQGCRSLRMDTVYPNALDKEYKTVQEY